MADAAGYVKGEQVRIGEKLFQLRDYTPIPVLIFLFFLADPTVASAVFGLLTVVAGEMIRVYSVAFIGMISRTRKGSTGQRLVSSGPFGIIRNPLYIGNFLIVFGLLLFARPGIAFMLLVVALFCLQYYYIVAYEEKTLMQRFGDEFKVYCEKVPAWWPRNLPKLSEMAWPASFSTAIHSERRTLTTIAAVVILLTLGAS